MEANNMAALREALVDTVSVLESILEAFSNGTSGVYMAVEELRRGGAK